MNITAQFAAQSYGAAKPETNRQHRCQPSIIPEFHHIFPQFKIARELMFRRHDIAVMLHPYDIRQTYPATSSQAHRRSGAKRQLNVLPTPGSLSISSALW